MARPLKNRKPKFTVLKMEMVNIDNLEPYPKNPRKGDIARIKESIQENGIYKPVVVNQKNNEILVGNHTYKAALELGFTEVPVAWVNVPEDQAKRIVLADNRIPDAGSYDDQILAELVASLPDAVGTGYTADEAADLTAALSSTLNSQEDIVSSLAANMPTSLEEPRDERRAMLDEKAGEHSAVRGTQANFEDDDDIQTIPTTDAVAELQAILELKEEKQWNGNNMWGIPDLREDMLLEEVPEGFTTWGGKDATPDDGSSTYLYNYGVSGMSGLPFDRAVLCFYTYDDKFENWWNLPAFYTSKMLVKGITRAVVPDFSFYLDESRAQQLYNVYRAQWVGRFFQEAGMKVIPRLQFSYEDPACLEFATLGIPQDPPLLMTSIQNVTDKNKEVEYAAMVRRAVEKINPGTFIVYGGGPAKRVTEMAKLKCNVLHLTNYAGVRRGVTYDKKEGTGKARKKLRKDGDSGEE